MELLEYEKKFMKEYVGQSLRFEDGLKFIK